MTFYRYYERKRVQTGRTQSEDFSFPVLGLVVIIILVFSTKENMFVEHTENMMMDIFWEFHAVA